MTALLIGLLLFFAPHSLMIVAPGARDRLVARIGEGPWKGLYSLLSAVGLGLIVWGYVLARQDASVLYQPPAALRHLALLLMVPVFPLLLATYLPGRIKSAVKHPMLAAVMLWASAHLLVNGALADVLLFGVFLVWAVADRLSMTRRRLRPVPAAPPSRLNDLLAVLGGMVLYLAFVLWLHRWLIGVPLV